MTKTETKWFIIGLLVLFLVLGLGGFAAYKLWSSNQTAQTKEKLATNQTQAAIDNGKDAVNTLSTRTIKEEHITHDLHEITNVIRDDKSPAREYDPTIYSASIEWMCKQASNSIDPKCMQQPSP